MLESNVDHLGGPVAGAGPVEVRRAAGPEIEPLAGNDEAEIIETAEGGQVRAREARMRARTDA